MAAASDAVRALKQGWWAGEIAPLGAGHINDTWRVTSASGDYVLQRINGHVFDANAVLENGARVTSALIPTDVPVLAPIASHGAPGFIDESGDCWRLTPFVPGQVYQSSLNTLAQVRAAGDAFARFQVGLRHLASTDLVPVIPGFLEFAHYLRELEETLAGIDRVLTDAERILIEKTRDSAELADAFPRLHQAIHGDCKINNLIFDGDRVAAIVDLDTAMFGNPAWDWGDLVRSASLTEAGELMPDRYAALVQGFAEHVQLEREQWLNAPTYVAAMLCVRFLNDHLNGDRYFKVSQHGENLARALHQRSVVEQLRRQRSTLSRLSPS
ncbi:MAG: aminoglycoside phosphotransferase family protein [Pseudomonadaceae bacterium]|nr:aminoglycoside phosphotransferase family protein [Pseudomonadaceae bacterium]